MNRDEAKRVLAEASRLNRLPYGSDMIDTWANALHDVSEPDALSAVTALARAGVEKITVAGINQWLREQRTAERRVVEARISIEVECGCTLKAICAEHRAINLAGIRKIKAEMAARKPVELRKSSGRVLVAQPDQGERRES